MLSVVLAVLVVNGQIGYEEAAAVNKRLSVRGVPTAFEEVVAEVRAAMSEAKR